MRVRLMYEDRDFLAKYRPVLLSIVDFIKIYLQRLFGYYFSFRFIVRFNGNILVYDMIEDRCLE